MNKGVHRFALLVACATFFLIIAGALVTSHDAGLATPDWPLSNGQFFPKMVGNLFWEHGHRLVATTVGLLTIGPGYFSFAKEERSWVRRLGLLALAGSNRPGAARRIDCKANVAAGSFDCTCNAGPAFFCTTVSLAVFTSASWMKSRPTIEEQGSLPVRYVCVAAAATIFLQLVIGATLRHSATWDKPLPTDLLLTHVGGAIAVTLLLGSAALMILRRHRSETFLARPAKVALSLLALQLCLGVAAYLTRVASPNDPQPLNPMVGITVAHVACGALVFATTIVLTLRAFKVLRQSS